MPAFRDAPHLYATLRALFDQLEAHDASASAPLIRSRLIIRLQTSQPEATITLDGSHNPLQRHYGPSPIEPRLSISLAADTLDDILSGRLSLTKALGQKSVHVTGPIWKAMPLAELFRRSQDVYEAARQLASAE